MIELDFDPASLRDWLAGVGLLRIVTETTDHGRMAWRLRVGRYRLQIDNAPPDLAARAVAWIDANKAAWHFGGHENVKFGPDEWRRHALLAEGIEANIWCAVASDAVMHRDGEKLLASGLEYGHGGGHQNWLGSLRRFMEHGADAAGMGRILSGTRAEVTPRLICRWDPDCERSHALSAKAPTADPLRQDLTINALAAIGLVSCPIAPTATRLVCPLVYGGGQLMWPIWLDAIRLPTLEAALCSVWTWPTMQSRRAIAEKLYVFPRGELREREASR